jgi:hypothetical protein
VKPRRDSCVQPTATFPPLGRAAPIEGDQPLDRTSQEVADPLLQNAGWAAAGWCT